MSRVLNTIRIRLYTHSKVVRETLVIICKRILLLLLLLYDSACGGPTAAADGGSDLHTIYTRGGRWTRAIVRFLRKWTRIGGRNFAKFATREYLTIVIVPNLAFVHYTHGRGKTVSRSGRAPRLFARKFFRIFV